MYKLTRLVFLLLSFSSGKKITMMLLLDVSIYHLLRVLLAYKICIADSTTNVQL